MWTNTDQSAWPCFLCICFWWQPEKCIRNHTMDQCHSMVNYNAKGIWHSKRKGENMWYYSLNILQSNITRYWVQYESKKAKLFSDNELTKDNQYLALTGGLWGIFSEFFGEKTPWDIESALHLNSQWTPLLHSNRRPTHYLWGAENISCDSTSDHLKNDSVLSVISGLMMGWDFTDIKPLFPWVAAALPCHKGTGWSGNMCSGDT